MNFFTLATSILSTQTPSLYIELCTKKRMFERLFLHSSILSNDLKFIFLHPELEFFKLYDPTSRIWYDCVWFFTIQNELIYLIVKQSFVAKHRLIQLSSQLIGIYHNNSVKISLFRQANGFIFDKCHHRNIFLCIQTFVCCNKTVFQYEFIRWQLISAQNGNKIFKKINRR